MASFLLFGACNENHGGNSELSLGCVAIIWDVVVAFKKVVVTMEGVSVKITMGISSLNTYTESFKNCSKSECDLRSKDGEDKPSKDIEN